MKTKIILIIGIIFTLVFSLGFLLYSNLNDKEVKPIAIETGLYQGPVQEGYDEQLFRETGIYKKIEENN